MSENSPGLTERNVGKETYFVQTKEIRRDPTLRFPIKDEPVPFVFLDQNDDVSFVQQRSPKHGRATMDSRVEKNVIFFDNFGNIFTTREWKGNTFPDFNNLKVSGENIWGAMTIDALKDIESVSQHFRKIGLPTEAIIAVHEVKTVMMDGEEIPIKEAKKKYKERRLPQVETEMSALRTEVEKLAQKVGANPGKYDLLSRKFLVKMEGLMGTEDEDLYYDLRTKAYALTEQHRILSTRYLDNSKFIVIERAMPIGDRLADLDKCKTVEDYKSVLFPVFEKLNLISKVKGNVIPRVETPNRFDTQTDKDIPTFLRNYMPSQMGLYLGRMHRNGISHGYAHYSNWSLAGILVDLDTADGNIPGENFSPTTQEKLDWDVFCTYSPFINAINNFSQMQGEHEYQPAEFVEPIETFIASYCLEYFGEEMKNIKPSELKKRLSELRQKQLSAVTLHNQKLDDMIWKDVRTKLLKARRKKSETQADLY